MSLFNKIKALGKGRDPRQESSDPSASAFGMMDARLALAGGDGSTVALALRPADVADTTAQAPLPDFGGAESSIISEVVPTDIGGASELRDDAEPDARRAALPLIGNRTAGSSSASSAASCSPA